MCLSLLHFQPCAGSEPDYNCCLSNKYTYMQLRSPEVTMVNFHLTNSLYYFIHSVDVEGLACWPGFRAAHPVSGRESAGGRAQPGLPHWTAGGQPDGQPAAV